MNPIIQAIRAQQIQYIAEEHCTDVTSIRVWRDLLGGWHLRLIQYQSVERYMALASESHGVALYSTLQYLREFETDEATATYVQNALMAQVFGTSSRLNPFDSVGSAAPMPAADRIAALQPTGAASPAPAFPTDRANAIRGGALDAFDGIAAPRPRAPGSNLRR